MKVIFLIDSMEDGTLVPESQAVVVAPEKLQLRQQAPGLAILGIEIGDNKFRPFINYPINLSVAAPAEPPVIEAPKAQAKPRTKKTVNSSKKKGR